VAWLVGRVGWAVEGFLKGVDLMMTTRRMPVPLVPGERGRAVLDAELPPLSREELDRILGLVGGSQACPALADGCSGDPCCPTCSNPEPPLA